MTRIISDLTRDTRPKLEDILESSIQDIVRADIEKSNDDAELVEYENHSFYYRVIFYFMQNAIIYYTEREIEEWSKTQLLHEVILPEI